MSRSDGDPRGGDRLALRRPAADAQGAGRPAADGEAPELVRGRLERPGLMADLDLRLAGRNELADKPPGGPVRRHLELHGEVRASEREHARTARGPDAG